MIEAARMVKRHWNGILRWFQTKIANGIMEAIKSGDIGRTAATSSPRGRQSERPGPGRVAAASALSIRLRQNRGRTRDVDDELLRLDNEE